VTPIELRVLFGVFISELVSVGNLLFDIYERRRFIHL
jgi:hypothetical protein